MRVRFGRIAGVAAITTLGAVGIGGTAFAHIEPDPPAAQQGATVTVGFMVEHGCAGSPTTGLDIKLPDGIADARAVDKPGWTATVDSGVVRFVGQSPSGEEPDTFSISFTTPGTPGEVYFPTVQKCLEGSADWLDIAEEGQPEPEHPAPAMKITAGPPSSDDLTPAADDETVATDVEGSVPDTGPDTTGVASAGATAPAIAPVVTDAATPDTAGVTATTTAPASDDDSNTGLIVGIVIAAVVVLGGGGLIAARARSRRATR